MLQTDQYPNKSSGSLNSQAYVTLIEQSEIDS